MSNEKVVELYNKRIYDLEVYKKDLEFSISTNEDILNSLSSKIKEKETHIKALKEMYKDVKGIDNQLFRDNELFTIGKEIKEYEAYLKINKENKKYSEESKTKNEDLLEKVRESIEIYKELLESKKQED